MDYDFRFWFTLTVLMTVGGILWRVFRAAITSARQRETEARDKGADPEGRGEQR